MVLIPIVSGNRKSVIIWGEGVRTVAKCDRLLLRGEQIGMWKELRLLCCRRRVIHEDIVLIRAAHELVVIIFIKRIVSLR